MASVDMPVETFEPYTGTQTSILILRKKTPDQEKLQENYEVFMAIPERVGHDRRGNPVYRMTPQGEIELRENGEKIIDDNLPTVAQMFREWVRVKGIA